MGAHAHRNRAALRDVQRRIAGRYRRRRQHHRARARRRTARRTRRDHRRHRFLRVRLSVVRLPAPASLGHRYDSGLRRRRSLLRLRLRAQRGRQCDARGRLLARAAGRHRRALDDGGLERSRGFRAVRRRRRSGCDGFRAGTARRARKPAALLGRVLASALGAMRPECARRSTPRCGARPTTRSR